MYKHIIPAPALEKRGSGSHKKFFSQMLFTNNTPTEPVSL